MKNPRREAGATAPARATAKRVAGEPIKPTTVSLIVRSLLAGAVFLVLLKSGGNSLSASLPVVVGFVVFMLIFGFFFDRWFYRLRMKRWTAKRERG